MSLKILMLEEEPEQDISYVPRTDSEPVADPELPGEFLVQDDVDLLQDAATAMESISLHIACEGMDLSTARELEKHVPGFMRKSGGHHAFTHRPSLEGLADAAGAVKSKMVEIIRKIRKYVSDMYKRFKAWLVAKFAKPEVQDIKEELNEFLAERRNRDAISFISELPDEADEAAHQVAILMDGDTKAFAGAFVDQLTGLTRRVDAIEKMLSENATHFELATGRMTVKELYKNDGYLEMLKKASNIANATLKTRNGDQFMEAMAKLEEATIELKEFEENMVVQSHSDNSDGSGVSFAKLYDNILSVSNDMKSVSVEQLVKEMNTSAQLIINIADMTEMDDILEMIPEDVEGEKQTAAARKIADFFRLVSKIGAKIIRLWKIRADSIESINKLGDALMGIVEGFEKAVVDAGASLTPEQKTQLAKALAGKGLKIVF